MKKPLKLIRNVLLVLLGLVLVVLITFQILMRPSVLTPIVNQVAADYVDGEVKFDEVKIHAIKSFPYLHLEASDLSITYPHRRYARFDVHPVDSSRIDTLAAFRELDLWVNYPALMRHRISVHKARLTHPRIFAQQFDSTTANWQILKPFAEKASADTASAANSGNDPWHIQLGKIELEDRPFIVYRNLPDTIRGFFHLQRLSLDGHYDSEDLDKIRLELELDSLRASGRLPADTVSLRLNHLKAKVKERNIQLEADAGTRLRTRNFGRLTVPVRLELDANVPSEEEVLIRQLKLGVSAIALEGSGRLKKLEDGAVEMDVQAAIGDCPLGDIIREYRPNVPVFKKIETDAHLHLEANAKGTYGQGKTPIVNALVQIPKALLDYEGMGRKGRVALDATVTTDENMVVQASVRELLVDILGAKIKASGGVEDVLGEDPLIRLNGTVRARVDSLTRAFTAERGISGTGSIDGRIQGKARLSQLDMAHIGQASIEGDLTARNLTLEDGPDSLSAFLPEVKMNVATKANTIDRNIRKGARVLALKADFDTLNVQYGGMFIRGKGLQLLLQNSDEILKGGKELTPLMGLLKVASLRLRDRDGLGLGLRDNMETFRITPASAERPTPRLSLSSRSTGVIVRQGTDLYALRGLKFKLAASRHQRKAPTVPRDSLRRRLRTAVVQDDFASADITISLGDAFRNYWRQWDIEGDLALERGRLAMPAFPLQTAVSNVEGTFNNDVLDLKNLTLTAGESDLSAQAELSGLRRALAGRGRSRMKLKADVRSDFLDANELMRAYAYYTTYEPPRELADASDTDVEQAVASAELPDSTGSRLIVIPSNLEVDFSLESNGIRYDSLLVSWAAADVGMRDRTIQVTNAVAASNMGDIYFEGFYSTHSKKDIKAGFDLNLVHITAEKVITLFPAIDTLMPLLTSFAGDLDCELAATSDIDTTMNLLLPTIDGIMKISGKDLSIKDSPEFTKIARLLKFRNKEKATVDNMAVTGLVRDNTLEIFPFVLDVDRYQMAASGIQHLNESFNYHVSVIKSPLLVKFGLNAWGDDFDHIHYGLGAAKYRSANVPVYTKQLDTVHYNLIAAIHNVFELGVEKALAENRSRELLPASEEQAEHLSETSLDNTGAVMEEAVQTASARREALKEEILQLQNQAAHEQ